jgi:hypothetical protein
MRVRHGFLGAVITHPITANTSVIYKQESFVLKVGKNDDEVIQNTSFHDERGGKCLIFFNFAAVYIFKLSSFRI